MVDEFYMDEQIIGQSGETQSISISKFADQSLKSFSSKKSSSTQSSLTNRTNSCPNQLVYLPGIIAEDKNGEMVGINDVKVQTK